jgi:hypothetical protein
MNKHRNSAAELAREVRAIKRVGDWTIRQWNDQVRIAIRNYLENMRRFDLIHKEEA